MRHIIITGAPSSAGANAPGLERSPHHLRMCGLSYELAARGIKVTDFGDCTEALYIGDETNKDARNFAEALRAATEVRQRTRVALAEEGLILLLGGDCTVSIGLVAAAAERHNRLGLAYLDSQTDLNTPETTDTGILDSMGLAHMLGCTQNALAGLGGKVPLMAAERVVAFGYHPERITEAEHAVLEAKPIGRYPATIVAGNAKAQAQDAVRALEASCDVFIAHFDVDMIDFAAFPVADAPVYRGFGLGFDDAFDALGVFLRSPKCIALSVTEFNPDRDRSRELGRRFVAALADALVVE